MFLQAAVLCLFGFNSARAAYHPVDCESIADNETLFQTRNTIPKCSNATYFQLEGNFTKLTSVDGTFHCIDSNLTLVDSRWTSTSANLRVTGSSRIELTRTDVIQANTVEVINSSSLLLEQHTATNQSVGFLRGQLEVFSNSTFKSRSRRLLLNSTGGIWALKNSLIDLKPGSRLEVHDFAYLEVFDTSSLVLGYGATLIIIGDSWVRIQRFGNLVLEDRSSCIVLFSYVDYSLFRRTVTLPKDPAPPGFFCHDDFIGRKFGSWSVWLAPINALWETSTINESSYLFRKRRGLPEQSVPNSETVLTALSARIHSKSAVKLTGATFGLIGLVVFWTMIQ